MSVDISGSTGRVSQQQPFDSGFAADSSGSDLFSNQGSAGQSSGGSINFGAAQSSGSSLNFGNPAQSKSASAGVDAGNDAQSTGGDLNQQITQMLSEIMKMLQQMMQQFSGNSGSGDSSSAGSGGSGGGSPAASADSSPPSYDEATASPPSYDEATASPPSYQDATQKAVAPSAGGTGTDAADTGKVAAATTGATTGSGSADATNASAGTDAVSGLSTGSGPRSFDITNNEDHDITLGMFDKDNNQVASMTLKPGETGTMNYQNDFTGLIKQADSDGKFQDSASRLEFYNGYINTSDIDGRNASISATDHNGFNIGDNKSIADDAPSNIVSEDSAGDKTIAGWYDGSTSTMQAGGQYMEDQLGTGDTYIHPNDDQLGEGKNPMRHTDAMNVDVSFGKA